VTADFALKRGVQIRGKVTGGPGGQPVRARVEYFAEASNPRVNDAPGFSAIFSAIPTGPDGSFAVAALPGRGALAVRAGDRFLTADKQGHVMPTGDALGSWPSAPYLLLPYNYHAIVRLDIRQDEREARCDIVLTGKGEAVRAAISGR